MSLDEAALAACATIDDIPILRFYGWSEPTISLGYFQEYQEFEALAPPLNDLAVVRRTTGGGAILHDLEVTYSIVMPIGHPLINGQPNALYRVAHDAVIHAIGSGTRMFGEGQNACDASSQRGPFFCFERRHDLDVVVRDSAGPGGVSKIAGSAQRRTTKAILQHGSIMLDSRFPQQSMCTWTSLAGSISYEDAVGKLVDAFGKALNMQLVSSTWSDQELADAKAIESRYRGDDWTIRRVR